MSVIGSITVQQADFSYKKQKEKSNQKPDKGAQKKAAKRTEKLMNKLADWSDDEDPSEMRETSSRFDKVVILKHMFTLDELKDDPDALSEIMDDVRSECEKFGEVTKVVVFDKESEGVISVRSSNNIAARACIQVR